eukprot:566059-Amphidinium_carterae.1
MASYLRLGYRRSLPTNRPWFIGLVWVLSGRMVQAGTVAIPSIGVVVFATTRTLRRVSGYPSQA